MTTLPRARCPNCGRQVPFRRNGALREHRTPGGTRTCPGSGRLRPGGKTVLVHCGQRLPAGARGSELAGCSAGSPVYHLSDGPASLDAPGGYRARCGASFTSGRPIAELAVYHTFRVCRACLEAAP